MEERIARLTGLPSHEGEETLSFRRSEAVGDDGHWFANVHHDKNKQPGRAATVILYLSSLNDTDGGHTIFPTLGRAGSEDDVDEFREAARLAYSQGRRALGCRDESAGCGDVGGLVEHARVRRARSHGRAQRRCRASAGGERADLLERAARRDARHGYVAYRLRAAPNGPRQSVDPPKVQDA